MTAIILAIVTGVAMIAVVVRKIMRRAVVLEVVKGIEKIQDEAQKKIDAVPEVPKKLTREEVRHALRVARDRGRN